MTFSDFQKIIKNISPDITVKKIGQTIEVIMPNGHFASTQGEDDALKRIMERIGSAKRRKIEESLKRIESDF